MKNIPYCILLALLLAAIPAHAGEKPRIAVLDLKAVGVEENFSHTVSNMIRTDLVNTGRFVVVERTQIDTILREQGFQMTGCTDQSCAVEIGKLISANKILIGEVSTIGDSVVITVRIVDVSKGVSEYAAKGKAETRATVDAASAKIVRALSARIGGEPVKDEFRRQTRSGYYLRSIVPGWGQVYAESETKGYIIGGSFIAAAGFFGYAFYNYNDKKKAYDDLPAGTPQSKFDGAYDDYRRASAMAGISLGVMAGVYLLNWIDVLFFTAPEYSVSSGKPDTPGRIYFSVAPAVSGNVRERPGFTISVSRRF